MSLEELLVKGTIEEFESAPELIGQSMESAEKDLATAKKVLEAGDCDWAYVIAYNSMLQAGRAFMFKIGYRPKGENKHISVVKFASAEMPLKAIPLVNIFNKMRERRHKLVYEVRDTVSKSEAEGAINKAEEFIFIVRSEVEK
ncbi:HEPN domain-containing protein [Candidatus Micrarchaeota archaeon]|nr:HEPN domain-containing protein [Candidatus Micrarchaeota archaeon]